MIHFGQGLSAIALLIGLAAAMVVISFPNGGLAQTDISSSGLSGLVYGADPTGEKDSYSAFSAAIALLPSAGGRITVPAGAYKVSAAPTWGTKSVYWDINPAATFSGAGATTFPIMATNSAQLAVGPWIQCQSSIASPAGGGLGCFNIEFLQPSTYAGFSVGLYVGVKSAAASTSLSSGIWAANFLTTAEPGFGGYSHTLELDLNSNSSVAQQTIDLLLEGIGTSNASNAVYIGRADTSKWATGITLFDAITGVQIINTPGMTTGITIGQPTSGLVGPELITQFVNGGGTIIGQRFTDTSPTGYFLYLSNHANTIGLFSEDVNGNQTDAGRVTAGAFITPPVVFALLDSSPLPGERSAVTNTSVCAFMTAVNGNGSLFCPVVYTGSAWVGG